LLAIPIGQFQMFCLTNSQTQRIPVSDPSSSVQLALRYAGTALQKCAIQF
jgi:hypothetical protein